MEVENLTRPVVQERLSGNRPHVIFVVTYGDIRKGFSHILYKGILVAGDK